MRPATTGGSWGDKGRDLLPRSARLMSVCINLYVLYLNIFVMPFVTILIPLAVEALTSGSMRPSVRPRGSFALF